MGIITDDRRAIELYGRWKYLGSEFRHEECRKIISELEKILPKNSVNEQFIEWAKVNANYGLGKIDYIEYVGTLCEILKKTVKTETMAKGDNFFLSNNEEVIIYNISAKYKYNGDYENAMKYIGIIYDKYKDYGLYDAERNIRNFELYMSYIASLFGSMGEYETSNCISKSVIKAQLKYGRIHMVHNNLASMAWNLYQMNADKKAYSDSLYQCMLWSQLRNDNYFTGRYKDRMSQL